jgi:subtilisin family serine protease
MRRAGFIVAFAAAAALSVSASAQLPDVTLPGVGPIGERARGLVEGAAQTTRELADLRRLRVRDLLRRHRAALEADPQGEPIVRNEVLAWSPAPEALARARAEGFEIARATPLAELDARLVVLQTPRRLSTRRALARLRALDPIGAYDFNHLYTESGSVAPAVEQGAAGARVGLIDGGVDESCPAMDGAPIVSRGFAGAVAPSAHGTAIAAILLGRSPERTGFASGAQLYAADVYGDSTSGGSADKVAQAFAWMARERVAVVSVSLVGPANVTLAAAVRTMLARGHVIVAAVGNDGPAARPLYPAAYEGVVGVTGVDAAGRVLREAGRGAHVDFAALGVGAAPAGPDGRSISVRGTSYAAPIVAGLIARELARPEPSAARAAIAALERRALDLGPRGRDEVYGAGWVGREPAAANRAPPARASREVRGSKADQ